MSIFDNLRESADKGTDAGKEFVSKSFEHARLKVFQVSAITLSMIVKFLIIGSLAVLGFIFLAISLAITLGKYLQNVSLGYLYVGLMILLFSLVFYFFRKILDRKIIAKLSEIFFD
ncbi:hypothetical protein [Polaribacter sp.]|uniref:hypothetical protein n=1 Tax=Polaribacter sp. TaxID=1920175 RepID=UPI003EFA0043